MSVESVRMLPIGVDGVAEVLRSELIAVPARFALLADASGATLAEDLIAGTALPRVDTAAMDGYAVSGPGPWWTLRADARLAGHGRGRPLSSGVAVRIATGAAAPTGTTAVMRDEFAETARVSGRLMVRRVPGAPLKDDMRRCGEQWDGGEVLVGHGTRVCPAVVSAAASAEAPTAAVRGPVRADVLITGDEIRARGPLAEGQTRDALAPVLPQLLRACDIGCGPVRHLPDRAEDLLTWFTQERDADMVVVTGATGHGAADHLRDVLTEIGARVLLDGVAMRPGGSQIVAVLPDGRVLLALPGNPFAAVAALLVSAPAIVDALTARTSRQRLWGRISDRSGSHETLTAVVPVRQLPGGVWQSAGAARTPHLADLIGCQALALLGPNSGRGSVAELLPLPQ
ncbi:molybdopterin-binding protein [Nocardia noduli]|uniref:molybdopterin-binding protein n=1 Tax=Nocardia noduli TaxID=2815722 RepID=UPI0027E1AFFB|nr:molybdopterin-binding protein [Nocardia noduli]